MWIVIDRHVLELGRGIATDHEVLLLDEIAGGLSEQECRLLVDEVTRIRSRGVSIIWIEHVVHALLAVVDRLVVINFGKKIDDGEPRTVMGSQAVRNLYMGPEGDAG